MSEFANVARNDPDRARMTLALMPDVRADQLMNEADAILRKATARTPVPDPSGQGRQMLVAAELARSGHEAGSELAHGLIEEAARTHIAATAKTPRSGGPKRVRFAEDVAVHEPPATEAMRIDDVLAETRVGMVDDHSVALWLPGSPETGPEFDVETIAKLDEIAPRGHRLRHRRRPGRPGDGRRQGDLGGRRWPPSSRAARRGRRRSC